MENAQVHHIARPLLSTPRISDARLGMQQRSLLHLAKMCFFVKRLDLLHYDCKSKSARPRARNMSQQAI